MGIGKKAHDPRAAGIRAFRAGKRTSAKHAEALAQQARDRVAARQAREDAKKQGHG